MKKTISVTLGGRVYAIEEDAYHALESYLARIRRHFAHEASVDELLADIEFSLGEKFSAKTGKQQEAITLDDVQEAIAVMGEVEEIADDESAEKDRSEDAAKGEAPKRLYRDTDDLVIAGVCSGLAAYFGIDPLFVRIIFVIFGLMSGFGILAYLILWIAVPAAETSAQKLEMRGKSPNLAEIQELVKEKSKKIEQEGRKAWERLNTTETRSTFRKILNVPVQIVGAIFGAIKTVLLALGPILGGMIGALIFVLSVLGLAAATMAATLLIFRINSPYLVSDIPLGELAGNPLYYLGVGSAFVLVAIPFILLATLGATIIKRKNAFRGATVGFMVLVWIAAAGGAAVAASEIVPWAHDRLERYEETAAITREFPLEDFTSIRVDGRTNLSVTRGETFSVALKGLERDMAQLDVRVENKELIVAQKAGDNGPCFLCVRRRVEGTVTLPRLDAFTAHGLNANHLEGFEDDLTLDLRDATRVSLIGKMERLTASLQEVSRLVVSEAAMERIELMQKDMTSVTLDGRSTELAATLSDVSRLEASDLQAENVAITTKDMARASLFVLKHLDATSSDTSRVFYSGDFASTTVKEFDMGRVREE